MGDMLSTATSGLLAFQRALDTTSHNISNVNTAGYSRQNVDLATRQAQPYASGWIGSGVDVQTVRRNYDQFVATESRTSSSALERLNTFSTQAESLNNLFGDSQSGLSATLQKFINSLQDLANSPSSIPARQVVLGQANSFADRLHSYDSQLTSLSNDINGRFSDEATAISSLAKNIADLNYRIEVDTARTNQPPNDLLDQRDHLLDQLATHVSVQVATQDNGSLIVSIGSGQPLVVGSTAATLSVASDPYDSTQKILQLNNSGTSVDVTTRLNGGSLGGMLDFKRTMLEPARNALGRLSIGLAETVNAQHREGVDLNGNFGLDVFSVGGVQTLARSSNVGTGAVAVTRQQPSAGSLTDANYVAEYQASGWVLRRADTGAAVTMSGAGTVASPYTADGMSLVMSGTPTVGDSFLIKPTSGAISGLNVLVSDPAAIAAAAPISTSSLASNLGTGKISAGEVLDATNAALRTPVTLRFNSATTYQVNGVGPSIAYTAGANIDLNGWRVVLTGAPNSGDSFSVGPNNSPAGDNRNALLISDQLQKPVFAGGTETLSANVGRIVGNIGVQTSQAQTGRDAQQTLHADNVRVLDSISGVNLDEEAANLVRFQQAYQAAAQAISIADKLFQTILAATNR